MLEYWKTVLLGGTADRRPGGRSDRPPQTGAAQASAPEARRRVPLPESLFAFPHQSILPLFHPSIIPSFQ